MNIGYFYWGFLGDRKYDEFGKQISTPDGNAFYSWSIIKAFIDAGHTVHCMTIDRDANCYKYDRENMFSAWCTNDRIYAYNSMKKDMKIHAYINEGARIVDFLDIPDVDMILIEWRWPIPGRNMNVENYENWQPDLDICLGLIEYANRKNIPFVVFDLDYKLTYEDVVNYNIKNIIELGNKWENNNKVNSTRVQIPFDFSHMFDFDVEDANEKVIYVGNRYERDWCINKYLPDGSIVYGNWLEGNRESDKVWPNLKFGKRLQTADMHDAYSKCAVTPLLAKHEYCKYGFVTARLLEAVFYGCLPLFIEEFSSDVLVKYVPLYLKRHIIVHDKKDIESLSNYLLKHQDERKEMIYEMRKHLEFMDAKYFVRRVMWLLRMN